MNNENNLELYDYQYPEELIAQRPNEARDKARVMIVNRSTGTIEHSMVSQLPEILSSNDLLIMNNSKVISARLFGAKRNGEPVEILLMEPISEGSLTWKCLAKKSKNYRKGDLIFFGMQAKAQVEGVVDTYILLKFTHNNLALAIKHHGVPPLPPYISRVTEQDYTDEDRERYQTVYASIQGSSAAPTAGLHISEDLLQEFTQRNIDYQFVTLHVGLDTFRPLRVTDISEHKMHGEKISIPSHTIAKISAAKQLQKNIVAVGTTTVRTLESFKTTLLEAISTPDFVPSDISTTTDIFIQPGYKFEIVDKLMTNFHQPKSSLIIMVSAFAGRELIMEAYQKAIEQKYRLFSYGDCMLIV